MVAFSLGVRQLGLWSWLLSKSGKPLASLFQLTPQGRGVWFFLFHVLGVFQEPIGTSCVQNASTCRTWNHSKCKHIGIAVARPGQVASLRRVNSGSLWGSFPPLVTVWCVFVFAFCCLAVVWCQHVELSVGFHVPFFCERRRFFLMMEGLAPYPLHWSSTTVSSATCFSRFHALTESTRLSRTGCALERTH